MRHLKVVIIGLISLAFLWGATWFLASYFKPKPSGVQINTTPSSSVYINGDFVGKTPYEASFPLEELSLRLIPDASDKMYVPFESRVSLTPGVKTVVRHEFAETQDVDAGFTVSFEKGIKDEAALVIISTPDNAQVSIDGVPKGFTPYKLNHLTPGEHVVTLKSIGFKDRELTANLVPGYRLSLIADLGKDEVPIEPEVAAVQTEIKTLVEISDTPTGFLRVRTDPGSAGSEIAQVKPGEKYIFLEEDGATGWYKIQVQEPAAGLPDGIVGWVSNQYSKKIEEEVSTRPKNQIPPAETPE